MFFGDIMNERWFLQTKKADFNAISKKYNISRGEIERMAPAFRECER